MLQATAFFFFFFLAVGIVLSLLVDHNRKDAIAGSLCFCAGAALLVPGFMHRSAPMLAYEEAVVFPPLHRITSSLSMAAVAFIAYVISHAAVAWCAKKMEIDGPGE